MNAVHLSRASKQGTPPTVCGNWDVFEETTTAKLEDVTCFDCSALLIVVPAGLRVQKEDHGSNGLGLQGTWSGIGTGIAGHRAVVIIGYTWAADGFESSDDGFPEWSSGDGWTTDPDPPRSPKTGDFSIEGNPPRVVSDFEKAASS